MESKIGENCIRGTSTLRLFAKYGDQIDDVEMGGI
jgi:hypothetical protein